MAHKQPRLALVAGDFHGELAEEMITAATTTAQEHGGRITDVIRVAGSYEVPLIVDRLLALRRVDAVVALGFIERGETMHGEVMGHVVHRSLIELQLKHGKPVGIGIIGPGATNTQAQVRKIGAAQGAVIAVLRSLEILHEL